MAKRTAGVTGPGKIGSSSHGASSARLSPHERLIEVARDMFCRDGIHATGIDGILAASGVSKMTLYGRFGSKEGLVRAVLVREGEAWRRDFFDVIEKRAVSADRRLSHVIDAVAAWFDSGRFYGCAFMNAVAEHAKGAAWLRDLAVQHRTHILVRLEAYARAAHTRDPAMLARQVLLLIDGVTAALMTTGDASLLETAECNLAAILHRS